MPRDYRLKVKCVSPSNGKETVAPGLNPVAKYLFLGALLLNMVSDLITRDRLRFPGRMQSTFTYSPLRKGEQCECALSNPVKEIILVFERWDYQSYCCCDYQPYNTYFFLVSWSSVLLYIMDFKKEKKWEECVFRFFLPFRLIQINCLPSARKKRQMIFLR